MTYRAAALPFGMLLMAILATVQAVRESTPRTLVAAAVTVAAIVAALYLLEPVFAGFGNWNLPIFLGLLRRADAGDRRADRLLLRARDARAS